MSQPPHNTQQMNPLERIGFAMSLIVWAIHVTSVFWILMSRKIGTIGPRYVGVNMFFAMFLMAILLPSCQLRSDQEAFGFGMWVMIVMFFIHLAASGRSRMRGNHVHTYQIGSPRFGSGKAGQTFEVILGLIVAAGLYTAAPVFGMFVAASAVCAGLTVNMFEERDRQRTYILRDRELEMQRTQELYERFKV